jgi:hypothetical protein
MSDLTFNIKRVYNNKNNNIYYTNFSLFWKFYMPICFKRFTDIYPHQKRFHLSHYVIFLTNIVHIIWSILTTYFWKLCTCLPLLLFLTSSKTLTYMLDIKDFMISNYVIILVIIVLHVNLFKPFFSLHIHMYVCLYIPNLTLFGNIFLFFYG